MRRLKRLTEKIVEALLTLSGALTSIAILLIIIFLFKEGLGLFKSPVVESGYALYVNSRNSIDKLSPQEIKEIYDYEITNWKKLGGDDSEIYVFRFDDIFSIYPESELGEEYSLLPQKLDEVIAKNTNIIAFIPQKYIQTSDNIKELNTGNISLTEFFLGKEWMPTTTPAPLFGILPLILGTLLVSFTAILIALPMGLGVAIYLSELADKRTKKILKPAIELLAGIPSVVYGFFGLVVLVPIIQKTLHLPVGETAFTGSLLLAIMALPTIISVAEDALSNTPRAMREASLSLGASHWQTIYSVVIPYSKSGISAAVILGIGRAIGETMAVLMVTGNAAIIPHSLFESVRTIPATIAAELGEAPSGGVHYQALFVLACVLFIITMIINLAADLANRKHVNKGL